MRSAGAAAARPDARALAALALERLERDRSLFVQDVAADLRADERLDRRGRKFFHELLLGVLRRRTTLDCVLAAHTRQPISEIELPVLQALRLGVYQLLFLTGVPPFAAVSESVRLVSRRHPGVAKFVNAVLRSIQRDTKIVRAVEDRGGASPRKRLELPQDRVAFFQRPVFADPAENRALYLSQVHSMPPFLVERWLARFDEALVESLLLAANRRPPLYARVHRLRVDREGLARRLMAEGIACAPGSLDVSLRLDATPGDVIKTRAFREGLFYLQDEAAMQVVALLDPQPGEDVLDLCAAPGGKSTHVIEHAAGRVRLVAVDRDAARLALLRENLARLGEEAEVVEADVLDGKGLDALGGRRFDAVLVDVPCSNTAVLARRPEARWRLAPEAIRRLADQGVEFLRRASSFAKPGGRLVYSTCSLEPEENREVVQRFLVAHPDFELEREQETLPSPRGPDGGYAARMRRLG